MPDTETDLNDLLAPLARQRGITVDEAAVDRRADLFTTRVESWSVTRLMSELAVVRAQRDAAEAHLTKGPMRHDAHT